MLFDLRSPGRRNTVRVVYLLLAVVMVAGLLLVGVGTGSGGGLLNALGGSNNNSNNNTSGNSQLIQSQISKAEKQVKASPTSSAAWSALFQARLLAARAHPTEKNLAQAAASWETYVKLSGGKPSSINARSAAEIYQAQKNYIDASSAWQYMIQALPASDHGLLAKPYYCVAVNAYAAGDTTKGQLASARTLQLTPELERDTTKTQLQAAAKTKTTAVSYISEYC